MQLDNKVAFVTGGASGLAKASCRALVDRGARVLILDRDEESAAATVRELGEDVASYVAASVTDETAVKAAVETTLSRYGGLHIVLNAAGTGWPGKVLDKHGQPHGLEGFRNTLEVNLTGTFNVLQNCAAAMAKEAPYNEDGSRGVIINVASCAAFDGQVGQAGYSASKAGVVGMTLPLARELAEIGLRVNTIAPGLFMTPLAKAKLSEKVINGLEDAIVFPKRTGQFAEFAALVCHIAENEYLNAEVIRLDGGIRMKARY